MTIKKFERGKDLLMIRGIRTAAKFIEVLGAETFTSLSLSLKTISEDSKWRVRL
jgi:hypothetical protein